MTAAQLFTVRPDRIAELPDLAVHPLVDLVATLDPSRLDTCGVCEETAGVEPRPGVWRVLWRFRLEVPPSWCDLCGPTCADEEIYDLIHNLTRQPAEIVLLLPASWALRNTA
jgi:hypothetical protein